MSASYSTIHGRKPGLIRRWRIRRAARAAREAYWDLSLATSIAPYTLAWLHARENYEKALNRLAKAHR